ncbi:hypothetical protein ROTAS13_01370 [Roseomonas sp. TAS13]|nr:hypothetical protein ROTAS13_01370 [Roseomonas sp. TAS13]
MSRSGEPGFRLLPATLPDSYPPSAWTDTNLLCVQSVSCK